MLLDRYHRQLRRKAMQIAQEDPALLLQTIAQLRVRGELAADELHYLEVIARRWIKLFSPTATKLVASS